MTVSPAFLRPSKLMHPWVYVQRKNCQPTDSGVERLSKFSQHTNALTTNTAGRLGLASLCLPCEMTSHFSFGEPEHSTREMGIKFCRKSPAVGSTNRHFPLGARISTLEKTRVAVSSRSWASAAAVGFRVPPALDTGTGSVGLKVGIPCPPLPPLAVVAVEEVVSVVSGVSVAELSGVAITVSVTVRVIGEQVVIDWPGLSLSMLLLLDEVAVLVRLRLRPLPVVVVVVATVSVALLVVVIVVSELGVPEMPPSMINVWLESASSHGAMSRELSLTTKHDPFWFWGWKVIVPPLPSNAKSCESVTSPP
jgi:hypothetical protein